MKMAEGPNGEVGGEEFIGSHEKANNNYGQNGYQGPSSDLPGQHTTSGFLPQSVVPKDDWQTRKVSAEQYPAAHGMKPRDSKIDFPTANVRKSSVPINSKSFQR
jgi:hypothetical protein